MATVRDYLEEALEVLGIKRIGQDAQAAEMDRSLSRFNAMLDYWQSRNLQVAPYSTLDDDVSLPLGYTAAVKSNMLKWIAPVFGRSVPPEIEEQSRLTYSYIESLENVTTQSTFDSALLTNNYSAFDALTGE